MPLKLCMLRKLLAFSIVGLLIVGALELFVRGVILPRDFSFLEVTPGQFPYFQLVEEYKAPWVTVKNRRREALPRGERQHRIAFVGDSVGFCATVSDENCFVEQIQKRQDHFDTYNYSVPGYGLLEVRSSVEKALEQKSFDTVVYVLNFNDIYPAQAVLLSLLSTPETRFASVDDYGSRRDKARGFVKDNFKLLPTAKYLAGIVGPALARRLSNEPTNETNLDANLPAEQAVQPSLSCHEQVVEELERGPSAYLYKRVYPAWQKMYRDPELLSRLATVLKEMKASANKKGARFLVVPFHDLVFFLNQDRSINNILLGLLKKQGIDYLDTYNAMENDYKACGMFRDPGHPGWYGNRILGREILNELVRPYRKESSHAHSPHGPHAVSHVALPPG